MALEAKRAAKLEKKLKTLLGGYQVRARASLYLVLMYGTDSIVVSVTWPSASEGLERCLRSN